MKALFLKDTSFCFTDENYNYLKGSLSPNINFILTLPQH